MLLLNQTVSVIILNIVHKVIEECISVSFDNQSKIERDIHPYLGRYAQISLQQPNIDIDISSELFQPVSPVHQQLIFSSFLMLLGASEKPILRPC